MKKLIGIAGKARSGKDTLARYLWERYGFTRIAFADPVKEAAQTIFGLSIAQTWEDSLKEVVIPYWGLSPRQMFQQLGTDAAQTVFGKDVWIKRLALAANTLPGDDIVVPDVRFESEAEFIRQNGGVVIHLLRQQGGIISDHVSESGVVVKMEDFIIANHGSLQDLYAEVDGVLGNLP